MVTLSDVARAAGVSLSTASRAINGSRDRTVNPALREKVLAAAAELRYSPNAAAQAIARGRTQSLSLVVHDITDPYFSSIAAGVTATARAAGSSVLLGVTNHDPDELIRQVDQARSQRSQALVLVGSLYDDADLQARLLSAVGEFRGAADGGTALVGQPLDGVRTIQPANRAGAADLARALLGQGHRRFALLTGPETHLTSRDRAEGFIVGLRDAGTVTSRVATTFDRDGGFAAMTRLIDAGDLPDVVFAATDVMAVGALAACREAGLEVPRDVGVAGFDDIPTLRDYVPSLSTVRVDLHRLGRLAGEIALTDTGPDAQEVGTEVQLRESTRRS